MSSADSNVRSEPKDPLRGHFLRTQIVEAAVAVFKANGLDAATVGDILKAANVSRRTFYRFFSSKDDVLDSVHKTWTAIFEETIGMVFDETSDPPTRLERVADAHIRFARTNAQLMRILFAAAHRPGSPMTARRLEALERISLRLSSDLRQTLGVAVDPFLVQGLLIAQEGIVHAMLASERMDDEGVARARATIVRMMSATLTGQGASLPPLPTVSNQSTTHRPD